MFSGVDNNEQQTAQAGAPLNDQQYQQQMAMQQQQVYPQQQGMMMQPQMVPAQPMQNNQMMMQPQMMNQQQMMMMQQQQNMMVNMGMGMPMMQGIDPMTAQLQQMGGLDKLRNLKTISIKLLATAGCSDMICCGQFGTRFQVCAVNPMNPQIGTPLMEVKFPEPGCFQEKVKGEFISLNSDQGQNQISEKVYNVTHTRACCWLKGIVSCWHICGVLNFYLLTKCCPSKSTLEKDGSIINKYTYGCCAREINILESDSQPRYVLKWTGVDNRELLDSTGSAVPGFYNQNLFTGYGKHRRFVSANVTFPDNMTETDKAAIIFGICKSIS